MRRNKAIIAVLSLAVILLTVLSQGTLAYYAILDEAVNVVTSGDISAKIIEKMGDGDFPQEGVYVMPGSVISKRVSVKNTGGHPFWLRVKLVNSVDGSTLPADVTEFDFNSQDWIAREDGFYYYKNPVEPDAETENLFTQVTVVGDKVDSRYIGKALKITVKAYAVQSENNGTKVFEAAGWPAEGGGGV